MSARYHVTDVFAEAPYAGHPALGTAHLLREVMHPRASAITLNLGVGPIVVCFVPGDSGGGGGLDGAEPLQLWR